MPSKRNRRHILVPRKPATEPYQPHPRDIDPPSHPEPPDRRRHAATLRGALLQAQQEGLNRRLASPISVGGAQPGLYIEFRSLPGGGLKLESLEDRRCGIELVAVQRARMHQEDAPVEIATVFVPDGALKRFFTRFREYAEELTGTGQPRHREMVDRIAGLRRATLRALWTDASDVYPAEDETMWWEVWLRRQDGKEVARLVEFAEQSGLRIGDRHLGFAERIVVLVSGSVGQLSGSLDVLGDVAEVRKAKESSAFFVNADPDEEADWLVDLKRRVQRAEQEAPAVCLLDTGITRGHPLLVDLVRPEDAMAVDPTWGGHDDGGGSAAIGHGTQMAGLAAYGDLTSVLSGTGPVYLRHVLESVKILPPRGQTPRQLYGAVTVQAVMRPEEMTPGRRRVFSMAVTAADDRDRGQPTSWSAAIDALAAGRAFDSTAKGLTYLDSAEDGAQRLFILSAGNVPSVRIQKDHLGRSDLEPVHDPAQAWNALTVGAFTERATMQSIGHGNWAPIASAGELSPWSTTSLTFEERWPNKPDLVYEGGNVASDGQNIEESNPDLCLLSTHYRPTQRAFCLSWATSAAAAQIARMAAVISADYPEFWPETIRALLIHTSEWTRAMGSHLNPGSGKNARARLIRRYGFGVPRLERALRSANDSLTLISQASMRPFVNGKMHEMHLHELPWPKEVLRELGDEEVTLRVTLSYFVEPNPGRRGWKKRHQYSSHGLRFDLKQPTETVDDFRKRLNKLALGEKEKKPRTGGGSSEWVVGEVARSKGSVHSDRWKGTAADLAERGVVGIYPVSGWWKERRSHGATEGRGRYALVLSIETAAVGVDIWTPVALEVGVPVEEEVSVS